jgi:hypothetical protein
MRGGEGEGAGGGIINAAMIGGIPKFWGNFPLTGLKKTLYTRKL